MPYTVNSSFSGFLSHVINTDPERTALARSSRQNLIDNIAALSDKYELPLLYKEKHINYGSFERKTKICEVDDVDMMLCISGCGGTYTMHNKDLYTINMPDGVSVLSELREEDGTLNSRKLINRFIQKLSALRDYRKAALHRNQEAMTLKFKSYEWNFDVVPCFFASDDFYLIPDGQGNWKRTDPRIDAARIDQAATQTKNSNLRAINIREFIRLMKFWKKQKWGDKIGSYAFEQLMLSYIETHIVQNDWQTNVHDALLYLSQNIMYSIPDPKGIQGNLVDLTFQDKQSLSASAFIDYQTAQKAISLEITANLLNTNHKAAIDEWHKLFGDKFKTYGQFYA